MFELVKTISIHININNILDLIDKDIVEITANDDELIRDIVDTYVRCLDDKIYYLIDSEDKGKIFEEVKRRLTK